VNTILTESTFHKEIKHSRFIALALKVDSEPDFQKRLEEIKKEYPDATHHVYAYILREKDGRLCVRFSDDGEPRNSAGKPVLAPIQGRDLMNVAVVVVRYFGGTKLGIGGLVRAYGQTAAAALEKAGITPLTRKERHVLVVSYNELKAAERKLQADGATIVHKDFGEKVTLHYEIEIEI